MFFPFPSRFHTFTDPSADPVKTKPSTVDTTEFTASSCAFTDSRHFEFDIFHTLNVLSHEPEYSKPSSSLTLRHDIASQWLIHNAVRLPFTLLKHIR
ncbi:hypothetical protein HanIR_Chr09g0437401 [Helianthus annuus]|nr:hypothetical protein HanIR_Chr09g0437401 [Helianthus annuus]